MAAKGMHRNDVQVGGAIAGGIGGGLLGGVGGHLFSGLHPVGAVAGGVAGLLIGGKTGHAAAGGAVDRGDGAVLSIVTGGLQGTLYGAAAAPSLVLLLPMS